MLMESYMLEIVLSPLLNKTYSVYIPENSYYANYCGQSSPSAFLYL